MHTHTHSSLLFLAFIMLPAAFAIINSCASSQPNDTSSPSFSQFEPDPHFDAGTYIDPAKYVKQQYLDTKGNLRTLSDTTFTPVQLVGYPTELYANLDYPEEARKQDIQGKVLLRLYVDSTGTIAHREVLESSHPLLVQAAWDAVTRVRFRPATLHGKPVNAQYELPLLFALPTTK